MDKNIKKLAELQSLRAWCITVIEFIIKVDPSTTSNLLQFKNIVESCFERKSLMGLKSGKREINDMVVDLSAAQRNELSELLALDSNEPLVDLRKEAECIVSKGYIDNDDDYRFLNNFIDYLIENGETEEIGAINQILDQYYNSLKSDTGNTNN